MLLPRAPRRFRTPRTAGFTMVELVVVIVLVGILGAVGAGRFFNRGGFDTAAYAEQAAAVLRFGQKLAIAQNRRVYAQVLTVSGRSAIALCYGATSPCAAAERVPAPSGNNSESATTRAVCVSGNVFLRDWYCEGVPEGATLFLSPNSSTTFYFNGLGRPYASSDNGQTSTFRGFQVDINGDGVTRSVAVSPETGYVF
jgi:MSHA pilin protein MshC